MIHFLPHFPVISLGLHNAKKQNLCRILFFLTIMSVTSGCQLTAPATIEEAKYSNYYLWLKNLSNQELLTEIALQKDNISANYDAANINLVLLYALPSSPIYNPYTAKTLLNNFDPTPELASQISTADFAFISLLTDQLNQQILTSNKLLMTKQLVVENESNYNVERSVQRTEISKLSKQIAQLKRIELDIESNVGEKPESRQNMNQQPNNAPLLTPADKSKNESKSIIESNDH